jgi:hypothetical protein
MKKTLQECKEIVAKGRGWDDWKQVFSYITATENLTDLANKMYYEQSEDQGLKLENERLKDILKILYEQNMCSHAGDELINTILYTP